MFINDTELNWLSSAIYRNRIPQSQLNVLEKIQLSVICTHMVDYCRPSHIYHCRNTHNSLCCFSVILQLS